MQQENEFLIARAQKGDPDAFEELLGLYEKRIYNLALRTMKNPDDAADMAQEAIIKIYRSLSGFKGDCSFGVWVHRITLNTCLDEIRRRKRRQSVSLENLEENAVQFADEGTPTPEESFSRREAIREISQAINQLEDDYRIAITLRDINGLSYQEISDITGAALGTVKSRISRARTLLQKRLKNYH